MQRSTSAELAFAEERSLENLKPRWFLPFGAFSCTSILHVRGMHGRRPEESAGYEH
jgi:hypothetical protein